MHADISIWNHEKYGGEVIEGIDVSNDGQDLRFYTDKGAVVFYCGTRMGLINLKNQIQWAYEKHLRKEKKEA